MSKQAIKYTGKKRKEEIVKKLLEKITKAKAFFLADYKGLTHQQLEQLRRALKKSQADFLVTKNTLLKLSLKKWNSKTMEHMEEELKNSTAALFAYGDGMATIKEIAKFAKSFSKPTVKIGIFAGKITTAQDFEKLATLPPQDVLLTTLVARLKSPLYGLHYALNWNLNKFVITLNNIKSKKPN